MSVTHTYGLALTRNGVTVANASVAEAQEGESNFDLTIAGSTTNQDLPVSINYTKIKGIFILFDKDTTVKTNSTSAPDQTLSFKANVPLWWDKDCPNANPITANLTHWYITTGADATACKIYVVLDV